MRHIIAYFRAFRLYLRTPKGHHDFWDYMRAAGMVLLTAFLVGFFVFWLVEC